MSLSEWFSPTLKGKEVEMSPLDSKSKNVGIEDSEIIRSELARFLKPEITSEEKAIVARAKRIQKEYGDCYSLEFFISFIKYRDGVEAKLLHTSSG
jgi:hypothetical protein